MDSDQPAEPVGEASPAAPDKSVEPRTSAGRARALMLGAGVLVLLLLVGLGLPTLLSRPSGGRTTAATASPPTAPSATGSPTAGWADTDAARSTGAPAGTPEPTRGIPSASAGAPATGGGGHGSSPPSSQIEQTSTLPPPQPELNWVQVWSDEFNGSSLGSAWYIDDYCPRPELVVVSAGVVSLAATAECGVDIRTFATFAPDLAVEFRARGIPAAGYETWGIANVEIVEASGHHAVGPFIRNDGFHTYRAEWIDGVIHSSVDGVRSGAASTAPFDWPSGFLRLYVVRTGELASRLEVDYIRVYRRA